jgi:hypothetical protein
MYENVRHVYIIHFHPMKMGTNVSYEFEIVWLNKYVKRCLFYDNTSDENGEYGRFWEEVGVQDSNMM